MAAPTDVLWLGNDGPPPPNPQTESVFHLSTAGDVLLPTLPNVSATGIAFDGTDLYFSAKKSGGSPITILTKRNLNGDDLHAGLLSPDAAGSNSHDLAFDIDTGLLWRMDSFDPAGLGGGSPKVTKFNPATGDPVLIDTFFVSPSDVTPSIALPANAERWFGYGIAHDQVGKRLFLSFRAENDKSDVFHSGVVLVWHLDTGVPELLFKTDAFTTGGMDYDPDTQTLWIGGIAAPNFVRHISLDPKFINPDGSTIVTPSSDAILATVKVPPQPNLSQAGFTDGLAFVRGRCP